MIETLTLDFTNTLLRGILQAWVQGTKRVRILISLSLVSTLIAIPFIVLSDHTDNSSNSLLHWISTSLAAFFLIGGVGTLLIISMRSAAINQKETTAQISRLIEKADEEPKAAWDIARLKLEGYLNRNLAHVKWIFVFVIIIMFFGFGIIGFGVFMVYDDPQKFKPSVVAACSGILTEFIGATFLLLYRSISLQATQYVEVLERINAVGMSLQILDKINDDDVHLSNASKAELAKQLVQMYCFNSGNKLKSK